MLKDGNNSGQSALAQVKVKQFIPAVNRNKINLTDKKTQGEQEYDVSTTGE